MLTKPTWFDGKALLCTLAVGGALVVFALALSPLDETVCGNSHQAANENCAAKHIFVIGMLWIGRNIDVVGTLTTAVATAFIARFTLTLQRSTNKLWDAGERQLKATTSAYVYPIVVTSGDVISRYIREAAAYWLDESKGDVRIPERLEIEFKIKNYGKTPAVLTSIFAGLGRWPVGALFGFPLPASVIGENETTVGKLVARMDMGLTPNEARNILLYTATLCFQGTIAFNDIWGKEQTTDFIFSWDKDSEHMVMRGIATKEATKEQ